MNRSRSRTRILRLIALFLTALAVVACASANKTTVKQVSAETMRSLSEGDYQKALDLQKRLHRKEPGNKKIIAGYAAIVEEAKKAADVDRSRKSFGPAAGIYRTLFDDWGDFSAFAAKLTFKKGEVEAGLRACRISLNDLQGRQNVAAGAYDKALAVYQGALKDYPGDETLREGYARAVDEIKAAGDRALAAKDFASAGKIESLLIRNLKAFEGLETHAALNGDELLKALKLCSSNLTNSGLAEYRQGNLERAIQVWEGLLAFEPGNAEIKKAVETAKAQLGKLRSVAPGGQRDGQNVRGDRRPD